MARPLDYYTSPTTDPTNPYRDPDPATVEMVVREYGMHAAAERWHWMSHYSLSHIASRARKQNKMKRKAA